MRVPLTTRDFLERAELVYGDRIGIVDEPTQPAPSLGEVSYREVARRARAMQAGGGPAGGCPPAPGGGGGGGTGWPPPGASGSRSSVTTRRVCSRCCSACRRR